MTRFEVFTDLPAPGLHVWRAGTHLDLLLKPSRLPAAAGDPVVFECELGTAPRQAIHCQLFEWISATERRSFEPGVHVRTIPRIGTRRLPPTVWLVHGSSRAVLADPRAGTRPTVRVHLITAEKYVHGELFVWRPAHGPVPRRPPTGWDTSGPYWDVALASPLDTFFQFKFARPSAGGWTFEEDAANRLWVSQDGAEIWAHSDTPDVLPFRPVMRQLKMHFHQNLPAEHAPRMRVRQKIGSDFHADALAEPGTDGWTTHRALLYTGLAYEVQFWNPTLPQQQWEHGDAVRSLVLRDREEHWTLEGDPCVFSAEPARTCPVELTMSAIPPTLSFSPPYVVDVWVNRARAPFLTNAAPSFATYPEVVTSCRFRAAEGAEPIERRTLRATPAGVRGFAVAGRSPILGTPPPDDLFTDPPFHIRRPGAYEEDGELRIVLHAPGCASVSVRGDWMPAGAELRMRSTHDGTYWWGSERIGITGSIPGAYHGRRYQFRVNGTTDVQDPAAGWVESSAPEARSRLVRRKQFSWTDGGWRTPDWDALRIYQLHPARFSNRAGESKPPLDQVAWEVSQPDGHLRKMRFNALQLMPVNEVGTTNSWGYDPAFFYAIEATYGGPDALKRLVDTCHANGVAVLLDVVFNHAGTTDNSLWALNERDFFDGDTEWGAMVNYDHPAVRFFFEQNIAYLLDEFHVDGFRFDFTRVIIHGHDAGEAHVRRPGSGGGWEFLQGIRQAARRVNPGCILMAEHLPNEWGVTNGGGCMDAQWCDDFHDRLKDACAGDLSVIGRLADACKVTHTAGTEWYNVVNYAESHDEVGNENGRIANVGGFGQGLRRTKVAAAITLMSRGIPMVFMGGEAGEWRQFRNGLDDVLDLRAYHANVGASRLIDWFNVLLDLRRSPNIKGPAPLAVAFAEGQMIAIARGLAGDLFLVANFGGWSGWKPLWEMNLPDGTYRELWNSTWPAFAVEDEGEHTNGGRDARLTRGTWLHVPDYGAVVLERV